MRCAKSSQAGPFGFLPSGMKLSSCSLQYARKPSSSYALRAKPTKAKSAGSEPPRCIEYTAGSNMRLNKSPLAPKNTALQGLAIRWEGKPSSSGFTSVSTIGGFRFDGVSPELIAQRGNHFGTKRFVLPRCEAREERERDRRCGNVFVDRGLNGPAAFAGIVDVAADAFQSWILAEGQHQEIQKPRTHDAGMGPEFRKRAEIVLIRRAFQYLETLTVGFQQAVLDAVVHHLGEMAGTGRPDVRVTFRRCEREKNRLAMIDRIVIAARSEEHTSELQSHVNLVCRLLLEKKKKKNNHTPIVMTKTKKQKKKNK